MAQQRKKDTTARDIKRKIEQVKKYVDQLQDLGVESCFCHISARTGGVFAYGHSTLRDVISKSAEDIVSKMECHDHRPSTNDRRQAFTLPRLPVPVDEMNAPTVKTVMTNLTKDLGISFKGPCPSWWPELVRFCLPWKGADRACEFTGSKTQTLCNTDVSSTVLT